MVTTKREYEEYVICRRRRCRLITGKDRNGHRLLHIVSQSSGR